MNVAGLPSIVRHLMRQLGAGNPQAELAVGLAVHATQCGHVCADLDREMGWGPWAPGMGEAQRESFRASLAQLEVVGGAEDWTPLVWDGRRLSLRRYWTYERQLATDLLLRRQVRAPVEPQLEERLSAVFADAGQRDAARKALANRLTLITGGPGTGKTTTLARLIGLLNEQAVAQGGSPLRVALAAPTGKAAARMAESLEAAGIQLPERGAMTLHRLLGVQANGKAFRHHRDCPLAVDLLVVDEASMIDLSLMAHLLAALPPDARLILLGDRDQLAAVEAGAVFADLCDSKCLTPCLATLQTNFRFGRDSAIGRLAHALRAGDSRSAFEVMQSADASIAWHRERAEHDLRAAIAAARQGYAAYLVAVAGGQAAEVLFAEFNRFRVLCALRADADRINQALQQQGLFAGLPVMVTRNDALLRLYNGDIGLMLHDPADGVLKACFPGESGEGVRWVAPVRLSAWEPAWAMTVHKSQGSEFERVMLVMPAVDTPVATRELVYTAVTRARRHLDLWASEIVLLKALENRAERMSGLGAQLAALDS